MERSNTATVLEDLEPSLNSEEIKKPPSDNKFIFSIISPGLFIFIVVILFPIITGILISFRDSRGTTGYFGDKFTLTNFYWLLLRGDVRTRDFWQYTYQTLFFAVVSLTIEFAIGIIFARLLNKKFRGRGLARATILIPWALPTIASATIFRYEIFAPIDQYGFINNFLDLLSGRPIDFFGPDAEILLKFPVAVPYDPYLTEIEITTTMLTAIVIDVWKTTPFLTLLILATLQIVPEDLNKAADIAGATGWQKFRYITWPLIRPGVGVALVFRMMDALRVYDAIVVFRDKEVRSMTWQSWNLWANAQEYGLASVVAIFLFIFIVVFALIIFGLSRTKAVTVTTTKRKPRFAKFHKKREKSVEKDINDIEIESQSELKIFTESKATLKEFSESKLTWIRIKLRSKKLIFTFSVIIMCLFCSGPFIWIILRSFRDPFIPQSEFWETYGRLFFIPLNNITIAIIFILFIFAFYFIISKSKPVLFAISTLFIFLFCAAPFIGIITNAQNVLIPKILVGFAYAVVFIMIILFIISVYFIFLKTTATKKRKITPSSNDDDPKSDSFGSKVKFGDSFKSILKRIRTIIGSKYVLFGISIFLILLIGITLFIWLSDDLISLGAFQVVFETSEFTGVSFDRALLNGFILSGLTVVVVLIIGSLMAYALAKFDFSGKFWITAFIPFFIQTATISNLLTTNKVGFIIGLLIIGGIIIGLDIFLYMDGLIKEKTRNVILIVTIIIFGGLSLFLLLVPSQYLDLRDNIFGLILPYSALNLPLAVFVLQAFFREIPEDLWKAAKVDGASNFQVFRKIILPLTIPGIFTCAILVFIASWNELLLAQIWLVSDKNHTVPRAMLRFIQSPLSLTADWDTDIALMAATSVATVPLVIVVLIFQKKIISGLTRGAVKG
jgi:trehalose/maltose transport system permease protein